MLSSFSVENYRSFCRNQEIDLRPLTLFFGWNSGGKSALVRFLPLIAESLQVGGPPIWLGGYVGRRATWPSIVCKASGRGSLSFSLKWQGGVFAKWQLGGDLEGRWQEVQSLDVSGSKIDHGAFMWSSLAPKITGMTILPEQLSELRNRLLGIKDGVQWISGVRSRPPRVVTYGGGAPATLRPDGADAVDHLIAAQLRSTVDPVLETTKIFFSQMSEQLVLDNPIEGVWRILLHPSDKSQVRVDLCDTGEGYSQVLPVLVALARATNGGPKLVCIEQPELHLHTRAQAELSRQIINAATSDEKPTLLIETHSEVLLTSIQLAIARGEIQSDLVRVYWIDSQADGTSDAVPVIFNEKGQPENSTLSGVFGEAVRLGQELIRLQMPR